MRITFVLPGRGLSGGIRVVTLHGRKLIERGHEVTIVCLRPRRTVRPKALVASACRDLRRAVGLDRDHLDGFTGKVLASSANALSREIPDGDVVLATHWLTADPVAALPASKGRKFYFIQGYEAHSFNPVRVDATWRLPLAKIVISRWLQNLARERFGDEQAILVPNGVDRGLFDAPPREPHEPPVVGLVYSPAKVKGSGVAAQAVRLAREKIPRLGVVLFGAHSPAGAMGLHEGAQFHCRPRQEELASIYASADVWLCASESEGFGLPPLEAMACRCVPISTRCGGPADFIEDGVNGFLVEVGDAAAMANRLVRVLSDQSLLKRMSAAAYETAGHFDWDRSTDLLEQALKAPVFNEANPADMVAHSGLQRGVLPA